MDQPTCPICAAPRKARAKTCGKKNCQYLLRKQSMPPCTEAGCDRPVISLSAGLCGSHYSIWYRANKKTHTYTCDWCGDDFKTGYKSSNEHHFCCRGHLCKWMAQVRAERYWASKGSELVLWEPPVRVEPRQRVFMAGSCEECGSVFVAWRFIDGPMPNDRYCTRKCSERAKWRRKSQVRGDFYVSKAFRLAIYERDNWTCQICGDPVDRGAHWNSPKGPSLDHIEPQSMTLFPDHTEANLRTACRQCNSVRQNNVTPQEIRELYQRRKVFVMQSA